MALEEKKIEVTVKDCETSVQMLVTAGIIHDYKWVRLEASIASAWI